MSYVQFEGYDWGDVDGALLPLVASRGRGHADVVIAEVRAFSGPTERAFLPSAAGVSIVLDEAEEAGGLPTVPFARPGEGTPVATRARDGQPHVK